MNSLLSMILAIVMVFSMAGGIAPEEGPVSFDAKISVDAEAIMSMAGGEAANTEETQQTVKVIGDILDVITLKGVADKDTVELDLFAGNDVLLSLGMKNNEEGSTLASSLLGSQVIYTSAALREQLKQQMMASMTQNASGVDFQAMTEQLQHLDKEQIKKDCEAFAESLTQAFEAKKGETETGEFTVDGLTFTARTPVNMTYTELMELILNGIRELLSRESFQPILQAYAQGTDISAELDKALEKLKEQAEEEKPELQLAIYTDDADGEYCVCDMTLMKAAPEGETATEEKVTAGFGKAGGLQRSHVSFTQDKQTMDMITVGREDGSMDMEGTVVSDQAEARFNVNTDPEGHLDMVCDINAQDTSAIIHVKTETVEDGRTGYSMDVYFGGTEKPLISLTGSAGKGGETISVFEGDAITTVPIENLMSSQDTTAANQLSMTLMGNLLKTVTILTRNLPEDTAAWVNAQIAAMMSPGGSTNEAPQGDPVISE